MRRYYYEGLILPQYDVLIEGDVFHHIFVVCRMQVGNSFELISNNGKAFFVEVVVVEKKRALVRVKEERLIPKLRMPLIDLYVSFPRISTFESIVEKSVEMGVNSIHPFLSEFSFIRTREHFPDNKVNRWHKIILQATQQSGRGDLMLIQEIKSLDICLQGIHEEGQLNIFSYEGVTPLSLKEYLQSRCLLNQNQTLEKMNLNRKLSKINIFVGSEGGYSHREVELFKEKGIPPVTIGDQILRVETACMALVSCLKYEFDLYERV